MATVQTSWWRFTGEYTPSDDCGISRGIYHCAETGQSCASNEMPAGALWVIEDDHDFYPKGPDGLSIACRLPDGSDWHIDGKANNCGCPVDNVHRCWVRHGTVGEPLTVDKNGHTCSAGAGSIAVAGYHGFLRNGALVDA